MNREKTRKIKSSAKTFVVSSKKKRQTHGWARNDPRQGIIKYHSVLGVLIRRPAMTGARRREQDEES